jgi:hypothetical protein
MSNGEGNRGRGAGPRDRGAGPRDRGAGPRDRGAELGDRGDGAGLRRSEAIVLGGVGLGGALLSQPAVAAARSLLTAGGSAATANGSAAATCVLTPELTEGPYWIDNSLTRRNITEGHKGLPLILKLTVVDADTCKPIKGADVELWHADASGEYSGFDGGAGGQQSSTRYLRGHQKANADGVVRFDTIFSG